jgi:uncharacterized membrane protein YjdF
VDLVLFLNKCDILERKLAAGVQCVVVLECEFGFGLIEWGWELQAGALRAQLCGKGEHVRGG